MKIILDPAINLLLLPSEKLSELPDSQQRPATKVETNTNRKQNLVILLSSLKARYLDRKFFVLPWYLNFIVKGFL